MPHARIDMHEALRPHMAAMSDAILQGMVEGLDMPADDLFQIFRLHQPGELVFSPTHSNADRTDIVFIEILASPVYSPDQMKRGMAAVTEKLAGIGIKRDNLLLMMTEAKAWHAPTEA